MKRYRTKGRHIKELREQRERKATQKEFAYQAGISERFLRKIENGNAAVTIDVLEQIAKCLRVPWQGLVFATDEPRLVPGAGDASSALPAASPELSEPTVIPRFDSDIASVVKDEAKLSADAKDNHVVVAHILTRLTSETQAYAEEMLALLESMTREGRDSEGLLSGRDELRLVGRLRELLVLLKGNDVWVYTTGHLKFLPESNEVPPNRDFGRIQSQLVIAFGPAGEYGEETLTVPIDHGHPWVYNPKSELLQRE